MKRIYLDHNATTPLDPRVREAMLPFLSGVSGNPSSLHAEGREARRAVEAAREAVADLAGADPREVIFCSGATEANNWAVAKLGLAAAAPRRILVSAIEHPSVLEAARGLAASGVEVDEIPVGRDGVLDLAAVEERLARPAALVAVMAVNNETGAIQPVASVHELCAAHGVPFHLDAVQAPGKAAPDPTFARVTTLALSAHKIGGPQGTGALIVRRGTRLEPWIVGGGQERERRAGTENVAGIVGFGAAARLLKEEDTARRLRLAALESAFLDALRAEGIPVSINGPDAPRRVPGTLNLRFTGKTGEGLLLALDLAGVAVSLGSACSSGAARPSHVLTAMGMNRGENLQSLRVSLGWQQSEAEMQAAAARISRALAAG